MDPTQIDKRTHSSLLFTPPNSSPSQSKHARHGMSTESSSSCCCGRLQCAYLQHNTTALDSLEKQLRSAAQLGQVRLADHLQAGNLDWSRSRSPWLLRSPFLNNFSSTPSLHHSSTSLLHCFIARSLDSHHVADFRASEPTNPP